MSSYETVARLNGELRIYVQTRAPIDLSAIQSRLGYRFASRRPHHTLTDPWEYAFGEPRMIHSEMDFIKERNGVVLIFTTELPAEWEAEILYYSPAGASAIYHWSSAEGILHPYRSPTSES
jgi:hypothetical protein